MLPPHLESEFRAPLGRPYSWASSCPARVHVALDQADIPPRAGPSPETRANLPMRCLGTRRAWNRPLNEYTKFCILRQALSRFRNSIGQAAVTKLMNST